MPSVSLICVWNDQHILESTLLPSVAAQSVEVELKLIDNRAKQFTGCAAALNAGAQQATGDYLAFAHQDIAFLQTGDLERMCEMMDALPDCGISGTAGAIKRWTGRSGNAQMRGSICEGPSAGVWTSFIPVEHPTPVTTLDELFLLIPRRVFQRLPFDPVACPGWHLYGVDYSLSVARLGLRPYVMPIPMRHLSGGTMNQDYFRALDRLARKHRRAGIIATTCGNWLTFVPPSMQHRLKRRLANRPV